MFCETVLDLTWLCTLETGFINFMRCVAKSYNNHHQTQNINLSLTSEIILSLPSAKILICLPFSKSQVSDFLMRLYVLNSSNIIPPFFKEWMSEYLFKRLNYGEGKVSGGDRGHTEKDIFHQVQWKAK